MRTHLRRPSPALLLAAVALFVALGGPAEAARLINGRVLKSHSVSRRALTQSAVKALRYTPKNSVTASKLRRNSVSTSELKSRSVGSSELRTGSVSGLAVADNSLLAQDLATGSVGSDELIDGSVRNAELAPGSVTASRLGSSSVRTSEVANGSLRAVDVGAFSGRVAVAVPALDPGKCATIPTAAQPALSGNQDMRDDVIIVGRAAGMPADLTVGAQPDPARINGFIVSVCAVTDTAIPAASYSLPFVTLNP